MSEEIRTMFGAVANRYDLTNQIISCGTHQRWRRRTVRVAGAQPGMAVLDCATGTGDLAFAFKHAVGEFGRVIGIDFSRPMIALAKQKAGRGGADVAFQVADMLNLPFADDTFDISSAAFGIRNVDDPVRGLTEMARVVRRGGQVIVLEFGRPPGRLFGPLFRWYSRRIIPTLGGWLSGRPSAYHYLTASSAKFPSGEAFVALMRATGCFSDIAVTPVTFGIAYIYAGTVA